jgi:hypothetical protein
MKDPCLFASAPQPPESEEHFCVGNMEVYRSLYQKAKGYVAIGDTSTRYLWDKDVPARIHEVSPDARIVILLRDPVERAYSHYFMYAVRRQERLTFMEAIQRDNSESIHTSLYPGMYLEIGLYYENVLRYLETFGREQVGIFLFEDMEKDTVAYMSAICRHIGVDPALLDPEELAHIHFQGLTPRIKFLYDTTRTVLNLKMRRKIIPPFMREWLRTSPLLYKRYTQPREEKATRYLQSIYEPDLCRLEELLGRKLPQLRRSWI